LVQADGTTLVAPKRVSGASWSRRIFVDFCQVMALANIDDLGEPINIRIQLSSAVGECDGYAINYFFSAIDSKASDKTSSRRPYIPMMFRYLPALD
jgi:hypothetical protein